MAFLTKEELKTVSDINLVNKITNLDDTIVDEIIDESIDLMKSYLSRYYDAEAIFAQEGDARKKMILKKLKDIVIYEIYSRNKQGGIEAVQPPYDEAVAWLEKMNTGVFSDRTLPPVPEEIDPTDGTEGDTRFGGNKRYSSIY
jgi:phage gp36-like protein